MKQFILVGVATVIFMLVALGTAQALALNYYGMEDTINEDLSIRHKITLQFDSPLTRLDYSLGFKVTNLTVEKNFDSADCRTEEKGTGSAIVCDFVGMTPERNQLTLMFTTTGDIKEVDGHYRYAVNYGISLPVLSAFTIIKLPKNGILTGDVANTSFVPADGKILTDGKRIMVFWNYGNLTTGNNLQFSTDFGLPVLDAGTSLILLYGISAAIVIALIGLFVYSRRPRPVEQASTAEIITSVLNEDEKRAVDIIAAAGGKVGQKIIVRESGFSKAKVSRLVKSLKARNVVDIEPISGRENRIILKTERPAETPDQTQK